MRLGQQQIGFRWAHYLVELRVRLVSVNPSNPHPNSRIAVGMGILLMLNAFQYGVNADTTIGHISTLSTTKFDVDGWWLSESADNVYVTTAGDVGKMIYLGLTLENNTGNSVFPRFDVVTMEVNK